MHSYKPYEGASRSNLEQGERRVFHELLSTKGEADRLPKLLQPVFWVGCLVRCNQGSRQTGYPRKAGGFELCCFELLPKAGQSTIHHCRVERVRGVQMGDGDSLFRNRFSKNVHIFSGAGHNT